MESAAKLGKPPMIGRPAARLAEPDLILAHTPLPAILPPSAKLGLCGSRILSGTTPTD